MTHIMIEDNTPEGKWLLELIRGHKSVTVMDEKKKRRVPGSVAECNGRPAAEFFDEMSRQAKEHFRPCVRLSYPNICGVRLKR